jgi:hypothetical protein
MDCFSSFLARSESEIAHVARFERHGASPAAAYAIVRMASAVEVRGLCPFLATDHPAQPGGTRERLLALLGGAGNSGIQFDGEEKALNTILTLTDQPNPEFSIVTPLLAHALP